MADRSKIYRTTFDSANNISVTWTHDDMLKSNNDTHEGVFSSFGVKFSKYTYTHLKY